MVVVKQFAIFVYKDSVSSQFTPPGNPYTQTRFLIISFPLPPSPFLWKVATLKSLVCWDTLLLPLLKLIQWWCDLSSLVSPSQAQFSSTSKPHPCEVLWSGKPVLLWGGLIRGDALTQTKYCEQTSTEPLFCIPQTSWALPVPYFNQETVHHRARDRPERLMNLMQVIKSNLSD